MRSTGSRPLWRGRALALVGLILVAANLRTAVTAASPIVGDIAVGILVEVGSFGIIGILPPACFALFGLLSPGIARVLGLDWAMAGAMAGMVVGNALRALATDYWAFLFGSVLAFAGIGVANVLLPALVKRYFPDRIGLLSTAYAVALSVSIFVPPLVAQPLADSVGWRGSLAVWALAALIGLLPWLGVAKRTPVARIDQHAELPVVPRLTAALWRSKVAWCVMALFAMSGINSYAMFAWLPQLLMERTQVSALAAGALLSLYGLMGVPGALLAPHLAVKPRNVRVLILGSTACYVVGNLGLVMSSDFTVWVWVAIAGLGQVSMPIPFVLIAVRTNSHELASELSGFVQGLGYAISALGPLLFILCRQWTDSWAGALILLVVVSGITSLTALPLGRPTQVEDDLDRVTKHSK